MGIYRKALIVCVVILCGVLVVYANSSMLESDVASDNEIMESSSSIILDELISKLELKESDNDKVEDTIEVEPIKEEKVDHVEDIPQQDEELIVDEPQQEDPIVDEPQQDENPPEVVEPPNPDTNETPTTPPVIPVDNTDNTTRVITDRGSFQHIIDNANSSQILGIDISHHQSDRGEIDWEKVAESKVEFAFIKVSEGSTYKDPYAQRHFEGARSQDIAAGGYHYARPAQPIEQDAKAEVAHFISRLKATSGDYGDLPAVLDLEDPLYPGTNGLSVEDLLEWAEIFCEEFEKFTDHEIIIYTGNWFVESWNDFNSPNNPLLEYPVWIADYYSNRTPSGGWSSWFVWQFSDKGKIDGITGDVDLNISTKNLLTYCK